MYEFNTEIDLPFDQAAEKVRLLLLEQHLSIVSDIDVQAIFKSKLDKTIPPYHIFGACNPKLAERVLTSEPNAGTLLPCNFVLRENESGRVTLSFMDPKTVLQHCTTDEPKKVASEAKQMLQRVVIKLTA
ncbi:MAG: DUF302 domain-containing protein [Candidatus Thiodiazotropha sp.]